MNEKHWNCNKGLLTASAAPTPRILENCPPKLPKPSLGGLTGSLERNKAARKLWPRLSKRMATRRTAVVEAYLRVSRQSPIASTDATTKPTALAHRGTAIPSTVTIHPCQIRSTCSRAINIKRAAVIVEKGFIFCLHCDEALRLPVQHNLPKPRTAFGGIGRFQKRKRSCRL